jgi:hypothetical protein
MYHAALVGKDVVPTYNSIKKPQGWSNEIETIWTDYLSVFYFDDFFWTKIWDRTPIGLWELQFPQYRIFIQTIIPMYIQRNQEFLVQEGLLVKSTHGKYLTSSEYDDYLIEEHINENDQYHDD